MIKKILVTTGVTLALLGGVAMPAQASQDFSENTIISDVGNQLLTGYADGKIKKGMELEEVQKAVKLDVPSDNNTSIHIVYNKENPTVFSLCGYQETAGSLVKSKAYKSISGDFSPMVINCNFGVDTITKLRLNPTKDFVLTERPDNSLLGFDQITAPTQTAPKVQDNPTNENAQTNQPKQEVSLAWIPFVLGGLAAIGGAIGLIVWITKLVSKRRENANKLNDTSAKWENYMGKHDQIKSEYNESQMDILNIINDPLMQDLTSNETREFHNALTSANLNRPESIKATYGLDFQSSDYKKSVESLTSSYETAKQESKRRGWSTYSVDERKRLERAKRLLNIAMDGNAGESERQNAYKQMVSELNGIIVVPAIALSTLEQKTSLSLTSGKLPTIL